MDRMTLYRTLEGRFREVLRSTPNPRDITAARLVDLAFDVLKDAPAPAGCPDELEEALGRPLSEWADEHGPITPQALAAALQLLAVLGSTQAHSQLGSAVESGRVAVNALRDFQGHLEPFHSQAKTLPRGSA